ncbi:hypothetical protein RUND412_008741 [Rhizina undulata]
MVETTLSRILALAAVAGLGRLANAESIATIDPVQDICQIASHMGAIYNNTYYTIGGSAYYTVPEDSLFSQAADNSGIYLMKSCNGFLRSIDLTKSFDASSADPSVSLGELPANIPLVKNGALWSENGKLYLWGGELEVESVYRGGKILNVTRPYPDGTIWEYDIASSTWSQLILASDSRTASSPSLGNSVYVANSTIQYYAGGGINQEQVNMNNGSAAEGSAGDPYVALSSMSSFDTSTSTWANASLPSGLNLIQAGALVYFEGIGDAGIMVSVGGEQYTGSAHSSFVGLDQVYVYDIASKEWYVQQTSVSNGGSMPSSRTSFCATGVTSEDGTSYNIYVYGGIPSSFYTSSTQTTLTDTWILSLPSFTWISATTTGGFVGGRAIMNCELVNNKYLLAHRGRTANNVNTCDTDGGIWLFDLENLTWTQTYSPPASNHVYQVPSKVYGVIGGTATGGAAVVTPSGGFTTNALASVFAKNASTTTSSHSSSTVAKKSGSNSNAGPITGGTIGGVVVLGLVGGLLYWHHRKSAQSANANSPGSVENQLMLPENNNDYNASGIPMPPDYHYEWNRQPALHEMEGGQVLPPVPPVEAPAMEHVR